MHHMIIIEFLQIKNISGLIFKCETKVRASLKIIWLTFLFRLEMFWIEMGVLIVFWAWGKKSVFKWEKERNKRKTSTIWVFKRERECVYVEKKICVALAPRWDLSDLLSSMMCLSRRVKIRFKANAFEMTGENWWKTQPTLGFGLTSNLAMKYSNIRPSRPSDRLTCR